MPSMASDGFVVGWPCAVTAHVEGIASLAFSAMRIFPIAASLVAMSSTIGHSAVRWYRNSDRIVADDAFGATGRRH